MNEKPPLNFLTINCGINTNKCEKHEMEKRMKVIKDVIERENYDLIFAQEISAPKKPCWWIWGKERRPPRKYMSEAISHAGLMWNIKTFRLLKHVSICIENLCSMSLYLVCLFIVKLCIIKQIVL